MTRILYLRPQGIANPRHPALSSPLFGEIAKIAAFDDIPFDPTLSENQLADLIRSYEVLLTMWQTPPLPGSGPRPP